jgi:hypothetical protein
LDVCPQEHSTFTYMLAFESKFELFILIFNLLNVLLRNFNLVLSVF